MAHSSKFPGLQQHSVGPIYPWSTVHIGGDRNGVRGQHLLDGRKGPLFEYAASTSPDYSASFDAAYKLAEAWIQEQIATDNAAENGSYVDAMIELSELGYPRGEVLIQSSAAVIIPQNLQIGEGY